MKWTIKNQADGESADIHINDFIGDWIDDYFGFGVTSKAFIKEIQDLPESVKTIRLHVNSPGGDVTAASHIANTLRDQQSHKGRTVEVLIEGAAWSAATIVTSAGNPTKIADNAIMMVHNPWMLTAGNADELRKSAEVLDKFRDSIVAAYRWKSDLSDEELGDLMDAETWMDADEAIANGLADQKIEGLRAAACFSAGQIEKIPEKMRDVESIPEKYRQRVQALLIPAKEEKPNPEPQKQAAPATEPPKDKNPGPQSPADIEKKIAAARKESEQSARDIVDACVKAGVPEAAADFLAKGTSADAVKARLADADKIRARCAAAGLPDRAAGYIKAGMTVEEAANDLFDVLIARQGPEIQRQLGPGADNRSHDVKPVVDLVEIYRIRKSAGKSR